jgi:thiamine biosynthesis lipoprotein ApbE
MRGSRWLVDAERGTARRLTNLRISLDAIAKGYIVAQAAARAKNIDGVQSVLLNIGGDIQHLGATGVKVGVASPFAPEENAAPATAIMLENAAIATSGGYRRSFTVSGKRVSHIVDPRTGEPASRIASASVIAPHCATADALSTAFSVMTPDESMQLADSLPGVGCYLIERDGTVWASSRWQMTTVPAVQCM